MASGEWQRLEWRRKIVIRPLEVEGDLLTRRVGVAPPEATAQLAARERRRMTR